MRRPEGTKSVDRVFKTAIRSGTMRVISRAELGPAENLLMGGGCSPA